MPLLKRSVPFNDSSWLFELKYDGFRALAVIENGHSQLISRNGHPFTSFADLAEDIRAAVPNRKFVVDGEIVCLDRKSDRDVIAPLRRPRCKGLLTLCIGCTLIVSTPAGRVRVTCLKSSIWENCPLLEFG